MQKENKKVIISVKNLHKTFRLPQEKHTTAKQAFLGLFRGRRFIQQHVLRGISFDVYEGDFFGIVGRNGSGKSTLLKILAGIYTYDSGSVEIKGRVSPFLELGVGFNPELTGWENIYLNGALLGLTKKQIDEKIDEIIDFAELREFIDQKLKNYSSGMQVRLAFAVAIHAHAPIILLDEVLAVGDANFQKKCFDVFGKLKKSGKTIVFVTHNMNYVKEFCNRAILLNEGKIAKYGPSHLVADRYENINLNYFAKAKTRALTNPREVHIVNKITEHFNKSQKLLEIGSGDGFIISFLSRTLGLNVKSLKKGSLLSASKKYGSFFISSLGEVESDLDGLLITDSGFGYEKKELFFKELINAKNKLKENAKIYIHLPSPQLLAFSEKRKSGNYLHLVGPVWLSEIMEIFKDFIIIEANSYGIDADYQYQEVILEKLGEEKEKEIWESLIKF